MSNTAPVLKEQSSDASQAARAAKREQRLFRT
jgi:hypothetical protein